MPKRGLGAFLTIAIVLGACSPTTESPSVSSGESAAPGATTDASTPPATSDERLIYASRETVDNAWALETDDAFLLTSLGVAEGLTRNGFDGSLEPRLATEWSRTGDLTWEFTLREGVTFHDGTPVDPTNVATALTHLLTVETPSRTFNAANIASVEASGANTVVVTSTAPNVLVPFFMASPNALVLAPKAYGANGIDPTEAGTGPFIIRSQNLPQGVSLDRNENYWEGPAKLFGVDVNFIPDPATRATQIQTGEAHIASSIPIPQLPTLEANPDLTVIRGDLSRTNSLYMNNKRAPFDDVRVRQAIQAAIDVDAIANTVLEGAVSPGVGPFSPTAPYVPQGAAPIVRDLDKANALLADAGIAPGSLTVGLWTYPSRAELPDVAVAVQAMLLEVGINVEVRVADYAALEPDLLAGEFDMLILSRGYLNDINDPAGYLGADYTCAGGFNMSHFCDPALDTALAAAVTQEDPQARYAVYSEIATQLQADAVDVFLYHPQELAATSTRVQGFVIHPMEQYLLTKDVTLGP